MKYFLITIETRDGECEYIQYVKIAVKKEETIEESIHNYMSKFWGDRNRVHIRGILELWRFTGK